MAAERLPVNAIALLDEQIELEAGVLEDQRGIVQQARAACVDAQTKIEALLKTREQLGHLVELYGGEPSPPPPIPVFDERPKTAAGVTAPVGIVAPPKPRPRQPVRTDDEFVDAIRANGGSAIAAEVAVTLGISEHTARERLAKLVRAEQLEQRDGPPRDGGGRRPRSYSIPAPRPGSPDIEEPGFARSPTERLIEEPLKLPAGESSEDALAAAEGQVAASTSAEPDVVPEPEHRYSAEVGDGMGPPEPTLNGQTEPAASNGNVTGRTSPNLSRLPKREAPPVSARTRRALKLPPKREAVMQLDERLWKVFEDSAPTAEWKINELQGQLGRRFPGSVPDRIEIGAALARMITAMQIVKDGDHYSRAVVPA